ncbi:MAG: hypothetical protein COZ05_17350 [Armatimonadetes bacterium CG_4_10_14_3_um_filter_59_10]|nr:MAG: hypothetical protein COZ05_17350 [Armatimonadetes bacterium CG_4_10_14_3_um_filter_59_10]
MIRFDKAQSVTPVASSKPKRYGWLTQIGSPILLARRFTSPVFDLTLIYAFLCIFAQSLLFREFPRVFSEHTGIVPTWFYLSATPPRENARKRIEKRTTE